MTVYTSAVESSTNANAAPAETGSGAIGLTSGTWRTASKDVAPLVLQTSGHRASGAVLMADYPLPLTSIEMHGRDLGPMPFDALLFSDYQWLLLPDRMKVTALAMMASSWQRRPVASLPASVLSRPDNGYWGGKVTRKMWQEHGPTIMASWVLCSDGMFYHRWLAKHANRRAARQRRPLAPEVREALFARDNYRCHHCGTSEGPFEADHLIPVIAGGSSDIANLVTSCGACNRAKGAKVGWRRLQ